MESKLYYELYGGNSSVSGGRRCQMGKWAVPRKTEKRGSFTISTFCMSKLSRFYLETKKEDACLDYETLNEIMLFKLREYFCKMIAGDENQTFLEMKKWH